MADLRARAWIRTCGDVTPLLESERRYAADPSQPVDGAPHHADQLTEMMGSR